jgi:ubiquinone/menaquinone biosynthesis C-methylase UbiE
MVERYSGLQARLHDRLIAHRAMKLHEHIMTESGLTRLLDQPLERHLLDVGCGGGQAAIRLAERHSHLRIVGIDLSPVMIRGACRRVLRPGGELLVADATSDASPDDVGNFFDFAELPGILKRPMVAVLLRRMFRPARPVETYRRVAQAIGMPPGTVSRMPSLPVFLFRTRKPPV